MDDERVKRAKHRALARRSAIFDRIKAIHDLGVAGESDLSRREQFLVAFNDVSDLWSTFSIENDTVLDAMVDLGEEFSSSTELDASNLVISIKTLAKRYSAGVLLPDTSSAGAITEAPSDNVGSSKPTMAVPCVSPTVQSLSLVRLPEIPLPRFEGNLTDWPVFRDHFIALVDSRSSIVNIEKFYYLLNCLGSEASEVVKGIAVSNETYPIAWSALVERYEQPRRLASSILEKMLLAPVLPQESVIALNKFLCTFDENIAVLDSLKIPDLGDFLMFSISFRALPVSSRRLFEMNNTDKYPRARDLFKFVKSRIQVLELAGGSAPTVSQPKPFMAKFSKPKREWSSKEKPVSSLVVSKPSDDGDNRNCPGCNGTHALRNCSHFLSLDVDGRYEIVSRRRLCMSCFSDNHWSSKCNDRCPKCQRRHHALLHRDNSSSQSKAGQHSSKDQKAPQSGSAQSSRTALLGSSSTPAVLLGTALVLVHDAIGGLQSVRALIDSGSQISAISAKCLDRLGLKQSRWTASVAGLAGHCITNVTGTVQISVQPRDRSAPIMLVKAWVLPNITSDMPSQQLATVIRDNCSQLQLADPHFDKPAPVDLLLGADVFPQLWIGEKYSIGDDLPTAYGSVFGWILIGPIQSADNLAEVNCLLASVTPSIETLIEKFWNVEEPEEVPLRFTDEGKCEDQFRAGVTIDETGRFSVPLPFRQDQSSLNFGDMYQIAARRFGHLERKLEQDEALGSAYRQFMAEYEALGHMTVSKAPGRYVIPHHAIWKKSGEQGKLRVVFDATARSSTGQSLNDSLYVGPKLQRNIVDVLLGFRLHRYAFSSDICKMYRQIWINTDCRTFQHILWRASPVEPLKEYTLNTVTYGISTAPFLALRVLQEIAERHCAHLPLVQEALLLQTYMDDICTGANTVRGARELRHDLIRSLKSFRFELKKWSANSLELLVGIQDEDRASGSMSFEDGTSVIQVLGIKWKPEEDSLSYNFESFQFVFTKRGVLSVIARIFDPLGFLAPVVLFAKSLMQMIWSSGIQWDDKLPPEILVVWSRFVEELSSLSLIRIPRFVGTTPDSGCFLCGFCDASLVGYAAVVYLCVICPDKKISVRLLGAKTKLAPMHTMTVPRLELCAASLLARWMARIQGTLAAQLQISGIYAWTDSSIVLSWLTTPHVAYKIFVSNRVHQVQKLIPECKWRHVPSEENPADCASRGLQPSELNGHDLYWNGPGFLRDGPTGWSDNIARIPVDQLPEVKFQSLVVSSDPLDEWFDRFSSYQRMLRVIAWVNRFVSKCRKLPVVRGTLSYAELNRSVKIVVKGSQSTHFPALIRELTGNVPVSSRQIAMLSPF